MVKIEVGKCYLARDGRKCFVYSKPKCLVDTFLFARVEYDTDELWENKLHHNHYMCNSDGIIYKDGFDENDQEIMEILSWFDLVKECE